MDELKHDPVPGYPRAFAIAFAIMGLYLAVILISSPGKAEKKYDKKEAHPTSKK